MPPEADSDGEWFDATTFGCPTWRIPGNIGLLGTGFRNSADATRRKMDVSLYEMAVELSQAEAVDLKPGRGNSGLLVAGNRAAGSSQRNCAFYVVADGSTAWIKCVQRGMACLKTSEIDPDEGFPIHTHLPASALGPYKLPAAMLLGNRKRGILTSK